MTFRYRLLSEVEAPESLASMTYPVYQLLLQKGDLTGRVVGVVAYRDDTPCGLALASPVWDGNPARVLSVFVVAECRRQGVAGELLARVTAQLAERGETFVVVGYPSGKDATPAVERLLARQGWATPQPQLHLFRASRPAVETLLRAPWMRPRDFSAEQVLFPWAEATEADRAQAAAYTEAPDFPHGVSPFLDDFPFDPDTSLGLRVGGRLVGWCVTHRVADDVLRYTCLFVHADAGVRGLGFAMFGASLRRVFATPRPDSQQVVCGVVAGNPMADFVRGRLGSYLPGLIETVQMLSTRALSRPA